MANVPQKTLNWLWGVLQREYHDAQRTYSDLAQTLSFYQGFAPRTDVYTFDNGSSALLLNLKGTIPVNFRGSQYRFPIAVWVPHAYPREPPIFYVTPTDGMMIRPGQHVSPSNGRIYHPYLARWSEAWERSNIVDFLKILADIFAREPPVMSIQQMPSQAPPLAPPATQPQQPPPPPRPPLPNEQRPPSARPLSTPAASPAGPPPPPPKPTDQMNSPRPSSVSAQEPPRLGRYDAPPPLPGQGGPPRPPSVTSPPPPPLNYQPHPQYQPQRQSSLRQSYAAPPVQGSPNQYSSQTQSISGPTVPVQTQQQPLPANPATISASQQPPPASYQQQQARPPQLQYPPQQNQYYQSQQQAANYQQQPQAPKPKAGQPNIMDESPFDVSLSSSSANLPTPAIPPNPEKQHILQTLQNTLLSTLQNQIAQSSSAFAPLQSQHAALQAAQQTLQQELNQLQTLHSQLQQNISSLTSTISSADRAISTARNEASPSKIPNIDDLIIPPTVVARQLYDNVAEQRGYEASIYALTDGLVRGRIGGELWARKTRECAREEFKRKWLVRRVGRGMGLDTSQMEI